jgi:hypothetical protein
VTIGEGESSGAGDDAAACFDDGRGVRDSDITSSMPPGRRPVNLEDTEGRRSRCALLTRADSAQRRARCGAVTRYPGRSTVCPCQMSQPTKSKMSASRPVGASMVAPLLDRTGDLFDYSVHLSDLAESQWLPWPVHVERIALAVTVIPERISRYQDLFPVASHRAISPMG